MLVSNMSLSLMRATKRTTTFIISLKDSIKKESNEPAVARVDQICCVFNRECNNGVRCHVVVVVQCLSFFAKYKGRDTQNDIEDGFECIGTANLVWTTAMDNSACANEVLGQPSEDDKHNRDRLPFGQILAWVVSWE